MATGSVVDKHSSSSVNSLKLEEREVREEAEMAAVGDIEAQQSANSEKEEKVEESTSSSDPFLVNWEGDNDPLKPINASSKRKFGTIAMIAGLAFLTYLSFLFGRN